MTGPFPAFVKKIGIIAPASGCDPEKLRKSIALLRSFGLNPVCGRHLFSAGSMRYLSAADGDRAADLNEMIRDESIDLLMCVRGGYGVMRILDRIDWNAFRKRSRLPLIGFSDITALHLAMRKQNAGIPVAAQMGASFFETMQNRRTFRGGRRALRVLSSPEKMTMKQLGAKLTVWNSGCGGGPLIPANLSLLCALCGTPYLPDLDGVVLVVEDIGEPVRKLDRMMTQLQLAGILSRCSALVFGQFSDCGDTRERNSMLREFSRRLPIPVYSGLEFGHSIPSESFVWGESCRIDRDGVFEVLQ